LLKGCLVQGGINVPFRRSPKPGPLSQGSLRKKREEKESYFKPPMIGFQPPPETLVNPPQVDFAEAVAEEVLPSAQVNTTSKGSPAPVS
jgi:hypothetical protein